MHRLAAIPVVVFLLSSFILFPDPFSQVVRYLGTGNADGLSIYMGPEVNIRIPGYSGSCPRARAVILLKRFFFSHPVRSFSLLHRGGGISRFGIGSLVTVKGVFRTTFYLRRQGNHFQLMELKFSG